RADDPRLPRELPVAARDPALRGLRAPEIRRVDAEPQSAVRDPALQLQVPQSVTVASTPAARQALESASPPRPGRHSARGRSTTANPLCGLRLDRGLTALIYGALLVYCVYPYSDFDWGLHYRYAEYFFTHHQILRHEIFSWTMPGYEWVNHS